MEESERIGFYSIGINILLVGIKFGLAVFSGSIALVADAIHFLSDVLSSATVIVGIKISDVCRVNILRCIESLIDRIGESGTVSSLSTMYKVKG